MPARVFLVALVLIVCGLPLGWVACTCVSNLDAVVSVQADAFRAWLLVRTLLLAAASGLAAVMLGLPGGVLLGRVRHGATIVWLLLPVPLLLPTLVTTYAWTELLTRLHARPVPQSLADEVRCCVVLATWLWPITAVLLGLTLRTTGAALLDQAALDGAVGRLIIRRAIAPLLAAWLVGTGLASQEFAVFEPTGISVAATEIRMVFETGAFSGPDNPIATLQGGVATGELTSDQPARAAAALAVGLPGVIASVVLAAVGALVARRLIDADDDAELRRPARAAALSGRATLACAVVATLLVFGPLAVLITGVQRPINFDYVRFVYAESAPRLHWSLALATATGLLGVIVTILSTVIRPPRGLLTAAVLTFLIGGQFVAIATIRLYNHAPDGLPHRLTLQSLVLRSDAAVVLADAGRFAWIALLAGTATWGGRYRELRQRAAADGATAWQTARFVVLPAAWPLVASTGVLMTILSLVEVPATALLAPLTMVPMLLTWVHLQRYGPMIDLSLLTVAAVMAAGIVAAGLVRWGMREKN